MSAVRDREIHAVPAVAAIIVRDRDLLMIRRRDEPGAGQWSIPGGCVEMGEELDEALRREIREETGLEVEVGDLAGVTNLVIRQRGRVRYHYVILQYFAAVKAGELLPASDAAGCRWVRLDELDKLDVTESLIDRLRELGLLARR